MTHGNDSGIGSSGDEFTINTMLENMHVEQQEHQQEESRRRDSFETAQEECFKLEIVS